MSLPGLTEKESLKLQRSVGSQNSEYKTALTPTESGEYILRSQKAGASNKEIAQYCNLEPTSKMVNEHKNLYLNLDSKLHQFVAYSDSKKPGQIVFDRARIISQFDKKYQELIIFSTIEHNFNRTNLEGIKQKLERSNMDIKEIVKEMAERKGQNLVVNFFSYIHDKKFRQKLSSTFQSDRDKIFSQVLKDKMLEEIVKKDQKKILSGTLGKSHYSLLITGSSLSVKTKKLIEERIEKIIYK